MLIQGFRLLDLTGNFPPGVTCTHLLADMGIDVIRVEAPADPHRRDDESDRAKAYDFLNRNKRSIVLDLKEPAGKEVFYRLVRSADAVLESYRPGTSRRLGIDYDTLKKHNEGIIYCSISGYGQEGPYAEVATHDTEASAARGAFGYVDDTVMTPSMVGTLLADAGAGLHAAMAILGALLARTASGNGCYIDIALADCVSTFQLAKLQRYLEAGQVSPAAHLDRAAFKCKDGKFIVQANVEPRNWERFCQVIGRPDFLQLPNADEATKKGMVDEIRKIMLAKTRNEWFQEIAASGASVAPCLEIAEVMEDPQVQARGLIWQLEHPTVGKVKQWGFPIKFSDGDITLRNFAPATGGDGKAILEELGYAASEVESMASAGAVRM
ncbi:MAG: CoA transferase [Dehalococcoidia bacterium]|nr:CoA transferase [Dehalococcoidia bacterium]